MLPPQAREFGQPPLWGILAEFLPFVLRLFTSPRQLVRRVDWDDPAELQRVSLYALIGFAILLLAFSDNRALANKERPRLSTYKGVVMRAHDTSWDWLEPVYTPLNVSQPEAKRLWDTLLTTGFLAYTFFAGLLGMAVVVRLRTWRFGIGWRQALGTGLLGYLAGASCIALSLVPLTQLLICRHCFVRPLLFVLLNLAGWAYIGFYSLADLGERPLHWLAHLGKSLVYGLIQCLIAFAILLILIAAVIPL